MNTPIYTPPRYEITVWFKPDGIPRYKASEKRKVIFTAKNDLSRSEYYQRAEKEAINQGIINSHGMEYWEPYKVDIRVPSSCRNRNTDHDLL